MGDVTTRKSVQSKAKRIINVDLETNARDIAKNNDANIYISENGFCLI